MSEINERLLPVTNCAQESAEAIKQIIAENGTKYQERILRLAFVNSIDNNFLNKKDRINVVRIIKNILREPRQFKYYSRRALRLLLFRLFNRQM